MNAPGASFRDRVVLPWNSEDESPPAFRSLQRRRSARTKTGEKKPGLRRRDTWCELLAPSSGVAVPVCPGCETRRRLLTFITDPRTIVRVSTRLDLPAPLPPLAPPRAPPHQNGLWPL